MELPDDDTIDALDDTTRTAIASHWLHRSASELGVAIAFEQLRPRLAGVGAAAPVLDLVDKAIGDERRHADLCARIAARYAGRSLPAPPARGGPLPDFGTGDEHTETALVVMGMCCINESIASEWIRSCWRTATSPLAVMANREHLQDEIDHARLGWAHLASTAIAPSLKKRLAPWVPRLVEVNVAEWKRPDEHLPPGGIPAHGHLSAEMNEAVVDAAVRDVVLPGFALTGLA